MPVPVGGSPQRYQPCHRPDPGQLRQPLGRPEGLLRPDRVVPYLDVVPGRVREGGVEKLREHGRRRLWMPIKYYISISGCFQEINNFPDFFIFLILFWLAKRNGFIFHNNFGFCFNTESH